MVEEPEQLNEVSSHPSGRGHMGNIVIDIESEDLTYNQARQIRL